MIKESRSCKCPHCKPKKCIFEIDEASICYQPNNLRYWKPKKIYKSKYCSVIQEKTFTANVCIHSRVNHNLLKILLPKRTVILCVITINAINKKTNASDITIIKNAFKYINNNVVQINSDDILEFADYKQFKVKYILSSNCIKINIYNLTDNHIFCSAIFNLTIFKV